MARQPKDENFLTREQLAEKYGVTIDAIGRLIRDESLPLPHLRFGRRILFDNAEVQKWMKRYPKIVERRRQIRRETAAM